MKTRIYYNLHKHLISTMTKTGKNKSWKVVAHLPSIVLRDAQFLVSEKGRQRVLAAKRKKVHAFIQGEIDRALHLDALNWERVRYNPYQMSQFQKLDGTPVLSAEIVMIMGRDVYAKNPK